MKKIVSVLLAALLAVSVCILGVALTSATGGSNTVAVSAEAYAVGERVSDGVIVSPDASYCGCCHNHNHGSGFGARISCFFCRILMFFKNLFGKGETNPEHKYKVVSERAASCSSEGAVTLRCAVCSRSFTVTSPKLSHTPTAVPARAATCTETGLTAGTKCAVCGAVLKAQTATPALGHRYTAAVTAPTCTAGGYTTYTCSVCGSSYRGDYTAAKAHTFGDWVVTKEAACTENGARERVCSACGKVETGVINALGHDYENHAGKAATCTEGGWEAYRTCTRCDYTSYKAIPALDHDLVYHAAKAATCTEIGWNAYDTCSRCDYTTYAEIPALGHDLVNHEAKAATCTEGGWEAYQACTRCDYSTCTEIPALGHDLVNHEAKDATCTGIGWNAYDTCARCDYSTYTEIPALGHDLVNHEAKAATCTERGWNAYDTCSRCDYSTYAEIPALGHALVNHAAKAPTCTEIGWDAYDTCSRCNYSTYAELAELGHALVNHAAQAPTCTEIGWDAYDTCARCDYSTYTELAVLGHDLYAENTATCTQNGALVTRCTRCDYTESTPSAALGHDFTDGQTVTGLTTAAGDGSATASYTCARCGAALTGAEISAVASVGGYAKVYHSLEAALTAAASASTKTVYLLRNTVIESDLTVPQGVTLVLPCAAGDTGYTAHDGENYCPDNSGTTVAPAKFRTLRIAKSVTVTVNGTLLVNAVTGAAAGGAENYGITGGYACIQLAGHIVVPSGGLLDCSGYVYDNGGDVLVQNGGKLYETYGVRRWRGGSYAVAMAMKGNTAFPIENYDFNFMRAKLTLQYGAQHAGTVKMYASSSYFYCHFPLIASGSNAIYLLKSGAYCERTVRADGTSVYKFYGNVDFSTTQLTVADRSMATDQCDYYKMDGNAQVEFYNGTVTCNKKFHLLPGFKMVVGSGAVLNVGKGGGLLFSTAGDYTANGKQYHGYYYYDQQYSSAEKWYVTGRDDAALYILDGGAVTVAGTRTSAASIAGRVYVDGGSAFTCNPDSSKTFDTITRYVAKGAVSGKSFLASVEKNAYETVLLRAALDDAAKAAAKTALGLN